MTAWSETQEAAYRAEIERRFRERTPAKSVMDILPEERVGRGELRGWCLDTLGMLPPFDQSYLRELAVWYRSMVKRVIGELDPENLASYIKDCRRRKL